VSDEQIKGTIRDYIKAMIAGDSKQTTSFLASDAVWTGPDGTYKGTTAIVDCSERIRKAIKDYKITENGMGIVVQGNTGVIEHDISGITNGKKWRIPAICIYEFKNDKIQGMRTFYDRLSLAKQAAGGIIAKTAVNSIVNAIEKPTR
jgi:ketosteroid isomerase-like protein